MDLIIGLSDVKIRKSIPKRKVEKVDNLKFCDLAATWIEIEWFSVQHSLVKPNGPKIFGPKINVPKNVGPN